ncbi:MAG TPA: PVC-type heme-binding CxxCH protein [Tepidisphaeraceae bacterium]|nr:PVC-type heme-binding CxxCH protein [Tepidisphaeraceae bacterium]
MRSNTPFLLRLALALPLALLLATIAGRPPSAKGVSQARAQGLPHVKVLFLGDNGHHVPLVRCRQVYSELARQNIDITYTDNLADLNPQTLGRYDTLLLYANWETISREQEKALLDYVEGGHGFAVIHCGSYCFLNSPKITALIGGRFKSHHTGVFHETIVQPDHPIEKGLKPIESWDETYVHDMHNEKNRTVLSYRIEGDHKEPYTWTRTQGKGRVFYTAWGHDQRTWGNENFQALLERGIRWSAGDWALKPTTPLKAFDYVEANVPSYAPGKSWGTAGKPITQMQEPVSPQQSMQHMVVPPGFEVRLACAEPQVKKPICMAFDERGRLWVAETFDYPNNMQPAGEGHDQITICESSKGDGVMDKFTVFADHLSIPTSMVFANGGLIVSQAPDMLFFPRDPADPDHAREKRVLFHGFGTRDTHAGPSNLHYGFDNWIYGTCGYSGFRGTVGDQKVSFGQGVYRFKPDGSKLEFLGSTTNNTWGLGLTEDNQVFGSTANGNPSWYLSIPNRYYEQVRGMNAPRLEMISDTARFWPITEHVRQVDYFGSYTAGAGADIYTARSFPQFYWNRVAFTAEPTGHLLGQFEISPSGGGFVSRNDFNLLASNDEWTAPIAATVGPDGALWMIDWYNFIVQHNPIPKGWVAGKGGAYETPLRDKRHGRVYRIIWKAGKPSPAFDLSNPKAPDYETQLIAALKSGNLLWRMHAQRLIVEHHDTKAIAELTAIAKDQSLDPIGLNAPAINALWALHGLGAIDAAHAAVIDAVAAALKHPSPGVRKAAVDVLPREESSVAALIDGKLLVDPNPQVRKAALLALAQMPASPKAGAAVYASLASRHGPDDRWLDDAAAIAACRHDAGFLKALFASHSRNGNSAAAGSGGAVGAVAAASVSPRNLIPNPSFEQVQGTPPMPRAWKVRTYSGRAQYAIDSFGHTGSHCLKINSATGSDTSLYVDVPVQPNTDYRLSAWIKTQDLAKPTGLGALLNVHGTEYKTPAVTGTGDWKPVEVNFNSGAMTQVSINCLYGGWGHATGTAWFDDVELSPQHAIGLPGKEGKVAGVVIGQYARRGPVESVVATLSAVKNTDPALAALVVNGLASGWPDNAAPKLSDADVAALRDVMKSLPAGAKDRLLALAGRWNRRDLFPEQSADAIASLRAAAGNSALDAAARADAARRLISVEDSPQTIALLLKQITPTSTPAAQAGILGALADSHSPDIGKLLVAQWPGMTPAAQKAALASMLRRSAWTGALLDGIQAGKINAKDLLPQQWQELADNPDAALASRARKVHKLTGGAPSADRAAIVKRLMPLASQPGGNAAKGRLIFEKNCMVCHTIDATGGKVGPELTGLGARPKPDILLQILDPNRAVEGTYRQWMCKTKDDVISGRIYAESKTTVEIMDAAGMLHQIQREDIQILKPTDKGLMPEGLEAIPSQDIVDLLEYLSQSKVKR